jgi:hypothetical protein
MWLGRRWSAVWAERAAAKSHQLSDGGGASRRTVGVEIFGEKIGGKVSGMNLGRGAVFTQMQCQKKFFFKKKKKWLM